MKKKWSPFRDDWSQGFDSDCFAHCSEFNKCEKVFDKKQYHKENHFKIIIILFDKTPC